LNARTYHYLDLTVALSSPITPVLVVEYFKNFGAAIAVSSEELQRLFHHEVSFMAFLALPVGDYTLFNDS
jgi:hypothetical protein